MTTTQTFAADTFDTFAQRDEFLGFGYIGGRLAELDNTDPEAPARPELVAEVDARVFADAILRGWTENELFGWANSKDGRWFADIMYGGAGSTDERWERALQYLRVQYPWRS